MIRKIQGLFLVGVFLLITSTTAAQLDDGAQLLVWAAPAASPTVAYSQSAMGQIAFLDASGTLQSALRVDNTNNRVSPCGLQARSESGRYFTYYVGADNSRDGGTLYITNGSGQPQELAGGTQYLACLGGNGRFQYSPDESLVAWLDYESDASQSEFADGRLVIYNVDDVTEAFTTTDNNVVSFDFTPDGDILYMSFFTNTQNAATEVAVSRWDGQGIRELLSFSAADGCRFTSGYLTSTDTYHWAVLGNRCAAGTEWQLLRIDPDGSNALLARTEDPSGRLDTISETSNIWLAPNGGYIFYTIPDGLSSYTVSLSRVPLNDLFSAETLIPEYAVMPKFGSIFHTEPSLSPDQTRLATAVTNRSQNDGNIALIELATGEVTTIDVEGENSEILYLQFTADSDHIIYIARSGETSSIYRYDIGAGNSNRIARGTYTEWALLSPDDNQLAVLEWKSGGNDTQYTDLQIVDLESGEQVTFYEGLVDSEFEFALPMNWVD